MWDFVIILSVSLALPLAAALQEGYIVRVCTNKACRKLGCTETLQAFKDLTRGPGLAVQAVGCLGQCGQGPMVAVAGGGAGAKMAAGQAKTTKAGAPPPKLYGGVTSPATVAAVLAIECGLDVPDEVVDAYLAWGIPASPGYYPPATSSLAPDAEVRLEPFSSEAFAPYPGARVTLLLRQADLELERHRALERARRDGSEPPAAGAPGLPRQQQQHARRALRLALAARRLEPRSVRTAWGLRDALVANRRPLMALAVLQALYHSPGDGEGDGDLGEGRPEKDPAGQKAARKAAAAVRDLALQDARLLCLGISDTLQGNDFCEIAGVSEPASTPETKRLSHKHKSHKDEKTKKTKKKTAK